MDPLSDKIEASKVENVPVGEDGVPLTPKQTKALLRKLDRHLIPFLSLLYLLSFLEYVSSFRQDLRYAD